jgi:hypothetical protein
MSVTTDLGPAPVPNRCFRFNITPMSGVHEGPLRRETDLRRTDMQELLDHQHLLDSDVRDRLERVRRKPDIYPARFFDEHYLPNSTLLVASRYPGAKGYAHCCITSDVNRNGTCRDHKFCPYCNYLVREGEVRKFVPAFDHGSWHFLTLSFDGRLPFVSSNLGATIDCWDACKSALQTLHDQGIVGGLHWTEELAVLSFLPATAMPHVHALVDAHEFGDEQLEVVRTSLSNWRNSQGEGIPLLPNLDVRPIHTPRSLLSRTRYLYKPINLSLSYDAAWANHVGDDRSRAWELNSQAREVAAGIFEARKDRNRMHSKGTLDQRNKRFIGIPRNERINHSRYLRSLAQEPAEYPEEIPEVDDTNVADN